MNNEDLLEFQQREEEKYVPNIRKIYLINVIRVIQKLMRQLVDEIHPLRSGISHNSTIKIMYKGLLATNQFKITWH